MADESREFEMLDLRRREDGTMEASIRYASGLEVVRGVESIKVMAKVQRGPESRAMGLEDEDLGLVSATYSNPATEMLSRFEGVGTVRVRECE